MASYRFYKVGPNARLLPPEPLSCDGDETAVALAARLLNKGEAGELWDGGRLIGRFSKFGVYTAA